MEVGSGGDQGQHIKVSAGHAHQLQGLGLGRTLQKIVGAIVGRRLELGANTYRVLVHPTSTLSRIQGVFVETKPVRDEAFRG